MQNNSIKSYRDLEVWQMSMDLTVIVYKLTNGFPKEEKYGLTSQTQRAAVSVPANIAEGHSRIHTKEFIQHLSIASGLLSELETHLIIALRLEYISEDTFRPIWEMMQSIGKMLRRMIQSLKLKAQ